MKKANLKPDYGRRNRIPSGSVIIDKKTRERSRSALKEALRKEMKY